MSQIPDGFAGLRRYKLTGKSANDGRRGGERRAAPGFNRWKQSGIDQAGILDPAGLAYGLSQGAFEMPRGLLQSALKSFDLLRYILKLPFRNQSSFGNLVSGAICFAHCGPDFHRDSCEFVFPGHVYPPLEADIILYHKQDYAILLPKKHLGCPDRSSREAPDQVPEKLGAGGTGRGRHGKRHRRVEGPEFHQSTTPRTRLADLKVEDVQNNIGPAIQQNNMPANHHMGAVRRRRR